VKPVEIVGVLSAYLRARRIDRIRDRATIECLQSKWLARHLRWVTGHSSHYNAYRGKPLSAFPVIGKREWLEHFNAINTVGADRNSIDHLAREAERHRDFSTNWRGTTYGLSSGTSGSRGLFLAGPGERATWAGTLLAKVLGGRLLERARIALVLRAGSSLYESVRVLRIRFQYVDPFQNWDEVRERLRAFRPTILVAPAQVLSRLASEQIDLRPRRIISVAEVLDEFDRQRIESSFGVPVEQIYQATEGFLGASCEHGTVHLNEPYLYIEREWQDAQRTRFVPIVTDLWRRVQPVIRYRLDDVLQIRSGACSCGRPGTAIAAIEGRHDDLLRAMSPSGPVPVFSDLLSRIVLRSIESLEDFEIREEITGAWTIRLTPFPGPVDQDRLLASLRGLIASLGGLPPPLRVEALVAATLPSGKRRRIRGATEVSCES
jgi:putative adenylate-forming enzyme